MPKALMRDLMREINEFEFLFEVCQERRVSVILSRKCKDTFYGPLTYATP